VAHRQHQLGWLGETISTAPVYSAAKGWAQRVDEGGGARIRRRSIRVNGIVCGTFDTDAAAGFGANADLLPESCGPSHWGGSDVRTRSIGAAIYLLSDGRPTPRDRDDHRRWRIWMRRQQSVLRPD